MSDSTTLPISPISPIMARRLAHVLRTPLSVIHNVLGEVASSSNVDPSTANFAMMGRRSVLQLVELAERFDWAGRIHTVADEPSVELQWPELVRRCVQVRCVDRVHERSRKKIEVDIAGNVGEGRAHREASECALAELLDNAARYARKVVKVTADVDGSDLRLRIIDDGTGMPNVADPFAPPHEIASRLGFGLWLVRRLTTALHGSVSVERTGNEGTVMCLRIPVSAPA